jgi:hypothetical protein
VGRLDALVHLQYDGTRPDRPPARRAPRAGPPTRDRLCALGDGRADSIPRDAAWHRTGVWSLGLLLLSACAAGPIGEGMYRDPRDRFTIQRPPTRWQPLPVEGAAFAFRSPELAAVIGLRVDCSNPEPGPLPAVARHLFFGLSQAEIETREPVVLSGASGMRTRLRARLDDRPVEVDGITVRLQGCLYDFMYVAPPDRFERGRADFDAFVASWTPRAAP